MSGTPDPAGFERALDALGPMLMADDLEEASAHATRLLADLSGAEAVVLFLVAGKDTGAEFWVPGDEDTRLRFRPHLRGLALESLARNEPVVAPFPPEVARDLEPAVLPLIEAGRVVALACFAGRARDALRAAAVGPIVARQVSWRVQAAHAQASKERNERWFRQFDQQMRALERERQKLAALVNQAGIYVYSVDRAGLVRWVSRPLSARVPAPDARGWIGRPAADLWERLFNGHPPAGDHPIAAALRTGLPAQCDFDCRGSGITGCHVSALPIREPDGSAAEFLIVVQDLGAFDLVQRMESELRSAASGAPGTGVTRQAEMLGALAARAAGEFGELLTVIMGNSGMMLGQLAEGHPLRGPAEEMRRAGTRGAELVRQLRTLSRRGASEPGPVDPDRVLDGAADLLRRVAAPAELAIVTGESPACIRGEREQLEQVLVDLVIHVRDRLPGGGRIVLERGEVTLGPDDACRAELTEGRYVTWSARGEAAAGTEAAADAPQAEGGGLGLSLAGDLARGCGGDLRLDHDAARPLITLRLPWLAPEAGTGEERQAA